MYGLQFNHWNTFNWKRVYIFVMCSKNMFCIWCSNKRQNNENS